MSEIDDKPPCHKEMRLFIGGVADGRRIEVDSDAEWWKAEGRVPLPPPHRAPTPNDTCVIVDLYRPFPIHYGETPGEKITVMAKAGMSQYAIIAALINGYRRETK
jgi:hypothetical protein